MSKTSIWVVFGIIVCSSIISQPVSALLSSDPVFRSTNGILAWDPFDCGVSERTISDSSSTLSGNDSLEKILRFYVSKDLTLEQAAGIAGNYKQESGYNPAVIQGGAIADASYKPVNGVGFGLAQWTWTSRQAPLVDLAKETNRPIIDFALQLDYSWQELTGKYAFALENLKETTTPDRAAYVFHRDYEGSADDEITVRRVRGGNAIQIFEQYKGIIANSSTENSATTVCSGTGESRYVNGFTFYNQFDSQWKDAAYGESTVGEAGAGPAAMAMIISTLTTSVATPADTAEYGAGHTPSTLVDAGRGGSATNIHSVIGSHWNLTYSYVGNDVERINQALRSDKLVLVAGSGSSPFTQAGHFIVIRAVTEDGKWLIGDSNGAAGEANNEKEWDPEEIVSKMGTQKYGYAFSGVN